MNEKVFTVTEITREIKQTIEQSPYLTAIWVKGEIYNLTFHSSGHIYFTLKDNNALINVTFFRSVNQKSRVKLTEGMSVLAFGNVSVFEKRGSYQLNVLAVKQEGVGELQKQIEELKKKLEKEGLFRPARKQALPFLPARIGIVTSPTGAAVRDIIKVALRRYPNVEIIIAPAKVQGDDAPATIVKAIQELNKQKYNIDVIIAGRGGGSFEDLMPFNTEEVVRAFAESSVPIVSAVGHQIDHPLSDDTADVSAPTPSAAAEVTVPVREELESEIDYYLLRMNQSISSLIRHARTVLTNLSQKRVFTQPVEIVHQNELLLNDVENKLVSAMKELLLYNKDRFVQIPDLLMLMKNILNSKEHQFSLALSSLNQLSPLAVMLRGYAIPFDSESEIVRSVDAVNINDFMKVLMHDGSVDCTVNMIYKGVKLGKEEYSKEK